MIRDERGSATAEFAVVVPAVVVVIALAVGALGVGAQQVRLEHGAAQAARLAARGEDTSRVRDAVGVLAGDAEASVRADGDFVCVDVTAKARIALPLPKLRASSCALDSTMAVAH
jgi:Flp pilus assembly pilin Flp